LTWIPESAGTEVEVSPEVTIIHGTDVEEIVVEEASNNVPQEEGFLGIPQSISVSVSADTLVPSAPSSPSNISNVTLVGSTGSGVDKCDETPTEPTLSFKYGKAPTSPLPERVIPKRPPRTIEQQASITESTITTVSKTQQLPHTTKSINSTEVKTSIIKIAPPPSTLITQSPNTLTISTSSSISTSVMSASSTTKTTITTPSIGVTFDRYAHYY
jgi:hypothetical protein